ncbi:MAG: DUF3987 domain-containing protein [Acidithiobacillus sp.]|nr:DUF3987 domain-containing protein [Acidithiobacillus sp.]
MENYSFRTQLVAGPGFHYDAFPPELLDIAKGVQNITHGPGAMISSLLVTALATTFQGMADVEGLNGGSIPLSVYLLASVASGEGKTSTLKNIFGPIMDYSRKISKIADDCKTSYRENLSAWTQTASHLNKKRANIIAKNADTSEIDERIEEHRNERPVPPRSSNLISDDITPAGLKQKFKNSYPFGVVASSDSGHVLNKEIISSMPFYSSLWSGEDINNVRADESFTIYDPRLSMVLLTQENYFDKFIMERGDEFRNSGLSGRFIIIRPQSNVGDRPIGNQLDAFNNEALSTYDKKITDALTLQLGDGQQPIPERRIVRLSQEARSFLMQQANEIEFQMGFTGSLFYIRECASKFIEYACRIAAIYELFQDSNCEEVSLLNAQRAFSFMCMNLDQYVAIFSSKYVPSQMMLEANELLSWLVRASNGGMRYINHRELMQYGPYMLRSKKFLEPIINILQSNMRINTVKLPGARSGRLRTGYQVVNGTPLEQNAI